MEKIRRGLARVDIQVAGLHIILNTLCFGILFFYSFGLEERKGVCQLLAVVWLLTCGVSLALSRWFFRRISNPGKKDLYSTDILTRLKNRNAFEVDIHNMENRFAGRHVGIIVIDLDHLKKVNDTQGHAAGDLYIQGAARCIREELVKGGWAYRIGGDEFVVMVPDGDLEQLHRIMQKIQSRFATEYKGKFKPEPSLSAGCAVYESGTGMKLKEILKLADAGMYRDKQSRRE